MGTALLTVTEAPLRTGQMSNRGLLKHDLFLPAPQYHMVPGLPRVQALLLTHKDRRTYLSELVSG
jgi:hypothetical protein